MKQPLFGLLAVLTKAAVPTMLAVLTTLAASAQQPTKDSAAARPGNYSSGPAGTRPGSYTADSFRLRVPGQRISLYAFCTPYSEGRAVYFRKDQDEAIHRVNFQNLSVALADNPASMQQLRIAHTNACLSIGLLAGGAALSAVGFIVTSNHDRILQNAYNQASAKWYAQSLTNPNTPMPAAPNTGSLSPLIFIGLASTLSCIIPITGHIRHTQRAIDTYNGVN